MTNNLLEIHDLKKAFTNANKHRIMALDGASLQIKQNEFVGLIGSSGSGKTTLARIVMGLEFADEGRITYKNAEIMNVPPHRRGLLCKDIQMIFQDPYTAFSNRLHVYDLVAEPLKIQKIPKPYFERVKNMLRQVGISDHHLYRYPFELSGGQRQRVAIARALILNPQLIVADEIVSMLDSSIKREILDLLLHMKADFALSGLFITHDVVVAGHICDTIAVMSHGRIVEIGAKNQILNRPTHPYTRELIDSVLTL